MTEKIVLKVDNKSYEGWTSISVVKSMRQMTGSFGLKTTDIYPGEPRKWNISSGAECTVEINDQKVITGYVEDILIDYDYQSHNIQFGGRDKTGDLIDCSYDETNKEWKGLSVKKVIEVLCEPFGISVVVDDSITEVANEKWPDNIKANEGDCVFDIIKKHLDMKGMIGVSYGDGKLTLTRSGKGYKCSDILQTGKNILKGSLDQSDKDRFQTYIVKGQGKGDDNKSSLFTFTSPVGRATDNVITRYRPIIIFPSTPCNKGQCDKKALWERDNRAGFSRSISYTVQGWTQSDGKVWPLNSMVQIKDDKLGINSSLLISELNFVIDSNNGSVTIMNLVHPDTFTVDETTVEIKTSFDWSSLS